MAYEHRLPEFRPMAARDHPIKEAYSPKLYHATVAAVWQVLAIPAENHILQIRIAQLVSCAAGVLTLLVALQLLATLRLAERARFFSFSLMALNPVLIGINAQATNDSFVYLF